MKKVIIIVVTILFIWFLVLGIFIFPKIVKFMDEFFSSDYSASTSSEKKISANDFTVYDTYNNKASLSDFTGKPTVVNFWATWCGYCVRELPYFENSYKEYGDEVNFLIVDMTDSSRETLGGASDFIRKYAYSFPVYYDLDGSASRAYSVRSIPMTLFLDKDGNLVYTQHGAMDSTELKYYINDLLENK